MKEYLIFAIKPNGTGFDFVTQSFFAETAGEAVRQFYAQENCKDMNVVNIMPLSI